jgi:hypothetical protein
MSLRNATDTATTVSRLGHEELATLITMSVALATDEPKTSSKEETVPLTITDKKITCKGSPHYALVAPGGTWRVSWLRGQDLDRNAAITAMTIAELTAQRPNPELDKTIDALAAEIGFCGSDALMLCLAPPMYGLLITSAPCMSRGGFLQSSSTHLVWFDTEEQRDRFAVSPFVESSHKMEDD